MSTTSQPQLTAYQQRTADRAREALAQPGGYELADLAARVGKLEYHLGGAAGPSGSPGQPGGCIMTRYCHHHGSLWLLAVVGMLATYAILLAAWVAWAALILPAAGISWAARNPALAGRLIHTLRWDLEALVGQ